ncbi:MAG: hypothetical protein BWY56_02605 [Acidobacteria bacterium ADurb.Bin340]|nr:MAG: hypothetical protein BWY56_02605 [Acidobacteria bacterium ADurb.Bin340]
MRGPPLARGAGPLRGLAPASAFLRGAGVRQLLALRHARTRLCACSLLRMRPRPPDRLLMQGKRLLPFLRRPPHARGRRLALQPRAARSAPSAVGAEPAQGAALRPGLRRRPLPGRVRGGHPRDLSLPAHAGEAHPRPAEYAPRPRRRDGGRPAFWRRPEPQHPLSRPALRWRLCLGRLRPAHLLRTARSNPGGSESVGGPDRGCGSRSASEARHLAGGRGRGGPGGPEKPGPGGHGPSLHRWKPGVRQGRREARAPPGRPAVGSAPGGKGGEGPGLCP